MFNNLNVISLYTIGQILIMQLQLYFKELIIGKICLALKLVFSKILQSKDIII